ncbi:hypothetical protein GY133_18405, partial [Acinetobacter baumannii]|nr:hypothetical protein [Acinetobacter baumannii]
GILGTLIQNGSTATGIVTDILGGVTGTIGGVTGGIGGDNPLGVVTDIMVVLLVVSVVIILLA